SGGSFFVASAGNRWLFAPRHVTGVNAAAKATVSTSAWSTVVRIIAVPRTWSPYYLNACTRWLPRAYRRATDKCDELRRLIAPRSLDITSTLHVLRKGRCPLWIKSGSLQTECLLWAKSRHVRRTCRSILLLLQHTHLRSGNGPPFLPSVARPALRIRASSSPCHLASSFLVQLPSPLLMQRARETLRRKLPL